MPAGTGMTVMLAKPQRSTAAIGVVQQLAGTQTERIERVHRGNAPTCCLTPKVLPKGRFRSDFLREATNRFRSDF
jgi:hypothetical protein